MFLLKNQDDASYAVQMTMYGRMPMGIRGNLGHLPNGRFIFLDLCGFRNEQKNKNMFNVK